jgi:hypothetical protein
MDNMSWEYYTASNLKTSFLDLKKRRCIVAAKEDYIFRPHPSLHTFPVVVKNLCLIYSTPSSFLCSLYILLNFFSF